MSALTYEIKDPRSPVALWLHAKFPHHKEIQSTFRIAAGPARVLPSPAVAHGTQGGAIDWWLRFLVDPAPSLQLPIAGVQVRHQELPCWKACLHLLAGLGVIGRDRALRPMAPARFADQPDEWWARLSYALALMVELYRTGRLDGSRLMRLSAASSPDDLLSLANDAEVTDLIAMKDLALAQLLPALPAGGRVSSGMTFDGSEDLSADADLIADGILVDFKAGQGGSPRKDGTRAASLSRTDLDQLLGYALMDYSDTFALHTVAIYAVRFGYLATWPLQQLGEQLAGHPIDLPALRKEFAQVLRFELPPYVAAHR